MLPESCKLVWVFAQGSSLQCFAQWFQTHKKGRVCLSRLVCGRRFSLTIRRQTRIHHDFLWKSCAHRDIVSQGKKQDLSCIRTVSVYNAFHRASCDWRDRSTRLSPILLVHMGVLDLFMLTHLNGTQCNPFCSCFLTCVNCHPDGEDHRRSSTGSHGVQPRHDQLCHHAASGHSEWGGEAAVGLTGP